MTRSDLLQRYVQAEWWDPSLETRANPVYHYDAARDKWIHMEGELSIPPFLALDNYCNSSVVTDIVWQPFEEFLSQKYLYI